MPFPKLPEEDEIEAIMADPQPGDRFCEMYAFWGYVLKRQGDLVTFITASSPCRFPDDGKVETLPLEEFQRKFAYNSMPGYWVGGAGRGHNVAGWLEHHTAPVVTPPDSPQTRDDLDPTAPPLVDQLAPHDTKKPD